MKIKDGPFVFKGRDGFNVVVDMAPNEKAVVGDRLRRADGAEWVLSGIDIGRGSPAGAIVLRGDGFPSAGDELSVVGKAHFVAWDAEDGTEEHGARIDVGTESGEALDAEGAAEEFCGRRFHRDDHPMFRKVHVRTPAGDLTTWEVETRIEPSFHARRAT